MGISQLNVGKRLITWFSVGVLIGTGVGAYRAVHDVNSHRYLEYGMVNLAIYNLQSSLNKWTLIFIVISLLGVLSSLVVRLGSTWVRRNNAAVQIVDRNRALALFLSMLLAVLFFCWYGPLILTNRHPPLHSIPAFLRGILDYLRAFMSLPMLPKGLLIIAVSSFIVVGFSWVFSRMGMTDLLGKVGKALTSRRITVLAVMALMIGGFVNIYAKFVIGRGGQGQKNVIMISVDTLRADHLGCYGYPRNTSPSMDSIARRGIFFENAFTAWPITTPAVASVFTSQYGHTNGVTRITPYQYLENKLLMLAEILKNRGYATEAVVTNGSIGRSSNTDQGFDVFVEASSADAKSVNKIAMKSAERFKQLKQDGKRFFFWVHYIDPHSPYKPPEFRNEFVGDRYYDPSEHFKFREPLAEVESEQDDGVESAEIDHDQTLSPYERHRRAAVRRPIGSALPNLVDKPTTEVAYHVAMYDAEIKFVDRQIQMLLNKLQEEGLLEDSIIVLWSDHGESLGEQNYYFGHGRFPYNACLRIPFMIVHPDYQPRKISAPVSLLDLTPTLLDLLGIKRPQLFDGQSLVPLIDGTQREQTDVFAESGHAIDFQKILIRGEWKLIHIPDDHDRSEMQGKQYELYNLAQDPKETKNLIELNPQVVKEMKNSLVVWMDSWEESFKRTDGQEIQEVEYSREALGKLKSLGYIK